MSLLKERVLIWRGGRCARDTLATFTGPNAVWQGCNGTLDSYFRGKMRKFLPHVRETMCVVYPSNPATPVSAGGNEEAT